jgi:predicted small metal-binding protein
VCSLGSVSCGAELHIASLDTKHLLFTAVKRINCVCGLVVEGDDDDELWENAQQHIRDDHPDLVGKVLRDDIVAQAEQT